MNKKQNKRLSLGLLVLAACASNSNLDGGATHADFSMNLFSSAVSTQGKTFIAGLKNPDGSFSPDGSGVTITSAKVNVEEIKIKLPENITCEQAGFVESSFSQCKVEEETEIEHGVSVVKMEYEVSIMGPMVFDLISGTSTPSLASLNLPSGAYTRIKIKIKDAQEEDNTVLSGDSILGYTLVAEGTFLDATSVSHPFSLALKFDEEIKIESNGVDVFEQAINQLQANLDIEKWFTGIDFAQCVQNGDLTLVEDSLVINENTPGSGVCGNVEGTIKENIKNSLEVENEHEDK